MHASDGDNRVITFLRTALSAGPRWGSSRALTGGVSAVIAVLAVVGIVALSTTGSPAPRVQDAAATTPASKPHYLLPIAALIQQGAVPAPTLAGDTGTVGVPTGTAARPTTAPVTTTPNPNSAGISTYRGASGTMTPAGIATLALERGCSTAEAQTATAVAMAESGGSPSAQGDVTLMTAVWDWSAGLWQIRGLRSERGTGGLRDSVANQRATTNSAAMYVVSSGCTNWSPWTTYTRGTYLGYLGVARQAVSYVVSYYKAHGRYPTVAAPDPTAVIPVSSGAGAAAAAARTSSAAPAAKPSTARPSATPTRAKPTTAAAGRPGGATTSTAPRTRTATPTPTPTKSTKPLIPLPTKILPSNVLPTTILPTCVNLLGVPVLC